MPGYVHTCSACGEQLLVAERYLGRELRCTGCGTPFTAALPPADPAVGRAVAARSGGRGGVVAAGAVLVVLLAALVLGLGGGSGGEPPRGRERVLGDGSRVSYLAAFDQATAAEVARLLARTEAERERRLRCLVDAYRVVEVPSGTRLEVLLGGPEGGTVQVRLLSGRWAEKTVWVSGAWVR